MGPVKGLNIFWRVLNAEKTISEGDVLIGAAVFYLKSETKVKSVSVKVKGEANVKWKFSKVTYVGYRRYFKVKEYLIAPQNRAIELAKGLHRLDFVLRIPEGDFPSSFRGDYGSIVYALEVKISRTWLRTSSITAELYFLSKSYALLGGMRVGIKMMEYVKHKDHQKKAMTAMTKTAESRQSDSVDKTVGIFSKGQVNMRVTADKKCSKGEMLSIVAHISNMSSKKVTPKFKLIQTTTYKVKDETNIVPLIVRSATGNPVKSGTEANVGCQLSVPDDISYSIHNCSILTVSHTIKVSLDISFAFDPTVLLPLDIIPAKYLSPPDDSDAGPSAAPPAAPHLE